MSGTIRVPDLPVFGTVTDDTTLVAEHSGTGQVSAATLRYYMSTTGGGPYMPTGGGQFTGDISTDATGDIWSGRNLYVAGTVFLSYPPVTTDGWRLYTAADGSRTEIYNPNAYDVVNPDGTRVWWGPPGFLMSLSNTGELLTRTSVVSQGMHSFGNSTIDGNAVVGGQISVGDAGFRLVNEGNYRNLYFNAAWRLSFDLTNGNLRYNRNGDNVELLSSAGATGDFAVAGQAWKPGGGAWQATSDSRIKTVTGDYTRGLAEIKALRPVRFTYDGTDTVTAPETGQSAPYSSSPNYMAAQNGTEFVGLIAQELQPVIPEMVTQHAGFISGTAHGDIMMVDRSALDLALVNAVKELEARVAALEAARTRSA